ncbi:MULTISPECIES: hypothetical protein [unclassified Streptomyces]|uniref:hypothetical protein n=1 Tax=unclassified Streptomyces TaxID=2593676 RepID=UPI002253F678|nr:MULTISPECIES: hypothetical protein [unclassified Streptomyces]MCX4871084.1 hypothetical protein [Streptomyces sp. NBC_00906]MCX4902688.1 hypothetical protein [Streptomyces sp. NBC_00892]
MSIVADQPLRAGLAEKAKRWEDEDTARGPESEPEARYVLSRAGWWRRALPTVPSLPAGYVTVESIRTEQEGDELRARHLRAEAIARFGWAR